MDIFFLSRTSVITASARLSAVFSFTILNFTLSPFNAFFFDSFATKKSYSKSLDDIKPNPLS